jgi:hypothetical protein
MGSHADAEKGVGGGGSGLVRTSGRQAGVFWSREPGLALITPDSFRNRNIDVSRMSRLTRVDFNFTRCIRQQSKWIVSAG